MRARSATALAGATALGLYAPLLGEAHRAPGASVELALQGGIAKLGEYYVNVDVGSPPQTVKLQVDTGSSSLIVTARECATCERGSRSGGVYHQDRSKSAINVPCESDRCGANTCAAFNCRSATCAATNGACCSEIVPGACGFFLEYGGDTDYHVAAEGALVLETLRLDGREFTNATIYATQKEEGPWPSSVDGILGLGFPRLNCNPTCTEPVYDLVLEQAGLPNRFALCMGDESGVLVLGSDGAAEGLLAGPLHQVPVLGSAMFGTYYTVGLAGMAVDGTPLNQGDWNLPRQAIVDSGTTLLLLEAELWDAVVDLFRTRYCHLPGVCSARTIFQSGVCLTSPPEGFPTLTFSLVGDLTLEMPSSLYFIAYDDPEIGSDVYCLGIQPAGHERTVLGDTLLRGFTTTYDLDARKVGFGKPNRSRCGDVRSGGAASLSKGSGNQRPVMERAGSSTVEAAALALGTLSVLSAGLSQVLLCMRATRGLHTPQGAAAAALARPLKTPRRDFGTF